MRPALLLLFHSSLCAVSAWQCNSVKVGSDHYDLSALDGEYTVDVSKETSLVVRHNVYTINPCGPVKRQKDSPANEQCPPNTLVCMVNSIEKNSKQTVTEVVQFALFSEDDSNAPTVKKLAVQDQEPSGGIRIEFVGGEMADGSKTSSSIDFICDQDISTGKPVYETSEGTTVANFKWRTKHACTSSKGGDGEQKRPDNDKDVPRHRGSSWGFFTWIFVIAFMAIASFLIFTLFLNYNRYGQVGLDLVPAMDSVKDIPYLFKDFASQVVETVKGSGSGRSGYSAV